jgi:RNA polymerase sigma-70 factor (ECF subfamily)
MRRLGRSEVSALESLMEAYWGPVLSYASRLLDDLDAGQDVAQAAFIQLWRRRAVWKPGSLKAYLFRLTRNLVIDELRRRGARARALDVVSLSDDVSSPRTPLQLLQDGETSAVVDRAIQSLPPRRREVFTLAYLRGFSYREIAGLLGISVKTVENHMTVVLAELRRSLAAYLAQ